MALYGYRPKTKPAPWQSAFPSQIQNSKPVSHGSPKPPLLCSKAKASRRQKPIRKVSAAQAKANARYRRVKAEWFARPENQRCILFPSEPASDLHHSRGRRGPGKCLLTETRLFVPLSRRGHDWTQEHPTLARALGLLCPAGRYDTLPTEQEIQEHEYRISVLGYHAGAHLHAPPTPLLSGTRRHDLFLEVRAAYLLARAEGW